MILLTSTSDIIQVITSAAGSIKVHASYIDNTTTAMTPGRSNILAITTATTTTVLSSPASSTQRNLKLLNIVNDSASISNAITIQHYDGTTTIPLWVGTLLPSESVVLNDNNFVKYNSGGIPVTAPPTYSANVQTFSYTGVTQVWTKPTAFTPSFIQVKMWGAGGGGGGGSSLGTAVASHGGAGGGGGAHNSYILNAADVTSSVNIIVGAGGTGGTGGVNGTVGIVGGVGGYTSFGTYLYAYGGGGGAPGGITAAATAGGTGGGTAGSGTVGAAAAAIGGAPVYNAATTATGGVVGNQGGGSAITATTAGTGSVLCAEFGGAAGAGQPATSAGASDGGSSVWGGAGGGEGTRLRRQREDVLEDRARSRHVELVRDDHDPGVPRSIPCDMVRD